MFKSLFINTVKKKYNSFINIIINKFNIKQEIGGVVWLKNNDLVLNKSENLSNKLNEFKSELDIYDLLNNNFQGFWHTHPKYCLPSLPDIIQMMKVNQRFKRNYLMIIFGKKRFSIVEFKFRLIPKIKFEIL